MEKNWKQPYDSGFRFWVSGLRVIGAVGVMIGVFSPK